MLKSIFVSNIFEPEKHGIEIDDHAIGSSADSTILKAINSLCLNTLAVGKVKSCSGEIGSFKVALRLQQKQSAEGKATQVKLSHAVYVDISASCLFMRYLEGRSSPHWHL